MNTPLEQSTENNCARKRLSHVGVLLLACTWILACGQTGPLILPQQEPSESVTPAEESRLKHHGADLKREDADPQD